MNKEILLGLVLGTSIALFGTYFLFDGKEKLNIDKNTKISTTSEASPTPSNTNITKSPLPIIDERFEILEPANLLIAAAGKIPVTSSSVSKFQIFSTHEGDFPVKINQNRGIFTWNAVKGKNYLYIYDPTADSFKSMAISAYAKINSGIVQTSTEGVVTSKVDRILEIKNPNNQISSFVVPVDAKIYDPSISPEKLIKYDDLLEGDKVRVLSHENSGKEVADEIQFIVKDLFFEAKITPGNIQKVTDKNFLLANKNEGLEVPLSPLTKIYSLGKDGSGKTRGKINKVDIGKAAWIVEISKNGVTGVRTIFVQL